MVPLVPFFFLAFLRHDQAEPQRGTTLTHRSDQAENSGEKQTMSEHRSKSTARAQRGTLARSDQAERQVRETNQKIKSDQIDSVFSLRDLFRSVLQLKLFLPSNISTKTTLIQY